MIFFSVELILATKFTFSLSFFLSFFLTFLVSWLVGLGVWWCPPPLPKKFSWDNTDTGSAHRVSQLASRTPVPPFAPSLVPCN
jgi:hypothetical protein